MSDRHGICGANRTCFVVDCGRVHQPTAPCRHRVFARHRIHSHLPTTAAPSVRHSFAFAQATADCGAVPNHRLGCRRVKACCRASSDGESFAWDRGVAATVARADGPAGGEGSVLDRGSLEATEIVERPPARRSRAAHVWAQYPPPSGVDARPRAAPSGAWANPVESDRLPLSPLHERRRSLHRYIQRCTPWC